MRKVYCTQLEWLFILSNHYFHRGTYFWSQTTMESAVSVDNQRRDRERHCFRIYQLPRRVNGQGKDAAYACKMRVHGVVLSSL